MFQPQFLKQINNDLRKKFLSPQDYASAKDDIVLEIIINKRNENLSFFEISANDFNYAYAFTKFCTEEEYAELEKAFSERITPALFETGWIYCQFDPNNDMAISLFTIACQWMKTNQPEVFEKTAVGRIGLPWKDIYIRSVEIMRIGRFTVEEFCKKFNIMSDTVFHNQLQLSFLSWCEKRELAENVDMLVKLIPMTELEFLRPAIKNYTSKFRYDEMPQHLCEEISNRLIREKSGETLGLSPSLLLNIRRLRFNTVLQEKVNKNSGKLKVYNANIGTVKNVESVYGNYFIIDFGNYIVFDNSDWDDHAFAYIPQIYTPLFEAWKNEEYSENYWPAFNEADIATAREIILGIKKANVIRLGFSEFVA